MMLRTGCRRIDFSLIRGRWNCCNARPVGARTDFQPPHWRSALRPSPRCPRYAIWASSSTLTWWCTPYPLPVWPHHGRAHQPTLVTSARKDRVQGRSVDLLGTARWCFSIPMAVYISRQHSDSTNTLVFNLGWSVRSCCQTAYCSLLDIVLFLSPAPVFGTLFMQTSFQHLLCSLFKNV